MCHQQQQQQKLTFIVAVQLTLLLLCTCILADELVVPGGRQRIAVDNAILRSALSAVQIDMEKGVNGSQYLHKMGKVTEAYSQVVAGLKFYVTIEMGETACLKGDSLINVDSCQTTKTKICQAEIWIQTWLNHNELLKFECAQ